MRPGQSKYTSIAEPRLGLSSLEYRHLTDHIVKLLVPAQTVAHHRNVSNQPEETRDLDINCLGGLHRDENKDIA